MLASSAIAGSAKGLAGADSPTVRVPGGNAGKNSKAVALHNAIVWLQATVSDSGGYMPGWSPGDGKYGRGDAEPTAQLCLSFMHAYAATGDSAALSAAKQIAGFADKTQVGVTGGWYIDMYSHETPVAQQSGGPIFYRTDEEAGQRAGTRSDITFYRNNQENTTGLLKCLMRLDQAEGRTDRQLEKVIEYGLKGLLAGAYQPSGGYPDWYLSCANDAKGLYPALRCKQRWPVANAQIPSNPPPRFPYAGASCSDQEANVAERVQMYSLNDATSNNIMDTLFEAWRYSGDVKYRAAAIKLADWMVRAQFPDPQPGWSQFYDNNMRPVWGRGFEPEAISSIATFSTIRSLTSAYKATGDVRYRNAAVKAYKYIFPHRLKSGLWPMWIQFGTDLPIYVSDGSHGTVPRCRVTTDTAYAKDYSGYGQVDAEDFRFVPREIATIEKDTCALPGPRSKTMTYARYRANERMPFVQSMPSGRPLSALTRVADSLDRISEYVAFRDHKDAWLDPHAVYQSGTVRENPCVYITDRAYTPDTKPPKRPSRRPRSR